MEQPQMISIKYTAIVIKQFFDCRISGNSTAITMF